MKKAETGRSMIEMLSTLVIMGLLCALALWGYTYGMNKHMANNIMYDVNWMGGDILNKYKGADALPDSLSAYKHNNSGLYTSIETIPDQLVFSVVVADVPSATCKIILAQDWDFPYMIMVDDEKYVSDTSICETESESATADMKFVFSLLADTSVDVEKRCVEASDCAYNCYLCENQEKKLYKIITY